MAISFPRTLPNNARMQEAWIDLIDNVAFSPSDNGNFINFSQINDPIWKGTFLTPPLERDVHPIWSAWRKSLRGGINLFIAYDVRRSAPYAYQSAKAPSDLAIGWDGTCNVTLMGTSGLLGLSALPLDTYQFKTGDRIGLEQNGHYGYYEVLEDVACAGHAATVTVSPFLHMRTFTTDAVCRIWRPYCQFMIDQSSWNEQGTVENTPVSFTGLQRL